MAKYIVGIDGGSQSSKVSIFDTQGRVVCTAARRLRPVHTPISGVVEHPDDDLYDSVIAAAAEAMRAFPGDREDIVGVGLCSIRCCRALVRQDLTLAEPVQSWMDERLSRSYEHTNPEVAYVTTASGYLMGRLTGQPVDTAANYIGPWPMDAGTWDWFTDEATFDSFGIPREMLYRLQLPGDVGGTLSEAFAASTGIPPGLPVVHTANDKAAEALGAGLRDERTALVSLGTYITGMVGGSEFVAEPDTYFTNFACEPYRYVYESAGIRRGMWTVSWLRDLLGAELSELAERAGVSAEDQLNHAAAKVPAGSDGLLCVLDWLAPSTLPHKRGMFLGFDARHGYGHLYRAVLEGIAFTMHANLTALKNERGIHLETLIVSGGGSYSDVFTQILADVFQLPAVRNDVRDSAGVGAAICTAVACGIYPNFDSACAAMVRRTDTVQPNPALATLYAELGAIHADIPAQIDPVLIRTRQALLKNQGDSHE